jgi:hypothetical protein
VLNFAIGADIPLGIKTNALVHDAEPQAVPNVVLVIATCAIYAAQHLCMPKTRHGHGIRSQQAKLGTSEYVIVKGGAEIAF